MDAYIDQLIAFIQANEAWAGPVLALITMGESMIVIGLFIPATALMIATGGLVGSGVVSPLPIVLWGLTGAVVGDALSYWLGRLIGPGLMRRWPFNKQRTAVARARLFFHRYGFASVLVGRFLGPIRSTIPTVAGMMRMGVWRFQLANALSALAWVPLMLAPGYLTARSIGAFGSGDRISIVVGTVISVGAGVWLLAALMRKRKPATPPQSRP